VTRNISHTPDCARLTCVFCGLPLLLLVVPALLVVEIVVVVVVVVAEMVVVVVVVEKVVVVVVEKVVVVPAVDSTFLHQDVEEHCCGSSKDHLLHYRVLFDHLFYDHLVFYGLYLCLDLDLGL